jgi:hypothetical protein
MERQNRGEPSAASTAGSARPHAQRTEEQNHRQETSHEQAGPPLMVQRWLDTSPQEDQWTHMRAQHEQQRGASGENPASAEPRERPPAPDASGGEADEQIRRQITRGAAFEPGLRLVNRARSFERFGGTECGRPQQQGHHVAIDRGATDGWTTNSKPNKS